MIVSGAQELTAGRLCLCLLMSRACGMMVNGGTVNIAKLNSYFVIAKTAPHSPTEPPKVTRK